MGGAFGGAESACAGFWMSGDEELFFCGQRGSRPERNLNRRLCALSEPGNERERFSDDARRKAHRDHEQKKE